MADVLYGLPEKVEFCQKCVISNQRPSSTIEFKNDKFEKKKVIQFENGVCSACSYQQEKEKIDWKEKERMLIELSKRFKSKDGGYNCIVPGSGGKDSAYTAHILKYKYGFNPLTVTWAPHLYTEIGFQNFTNWMHVGGLDNLLFTPSGKLHRLLTKLAFENLLHPFQPFIIGQRIIGPMMAKKFGVNLVFYGENQAEYGNSVNDNLRPTMDPSFFSSKNPLEMKFGGITMKEIINKYPFKADDFSPYIPPHPDDHSFKKIEVHYLGYYLKWDPQECYYYASQNTGFSANTVRTEGSYSKYSSIDDKIDPFHYYTTYIKFGIGRATYDAAQEIRNGKITREEGVALVKKYDHEFPHKYFKEFLEYIDLSEQRFFEIIDSGRSPHLWKKEDNRWSLKHTVF